MANRPLTFDETVAATWAEFAPNLKQQRLSWERSKIKLRIVIEVENIKAFFADYRGGLYRIKEIPLEGIKDYGYDLRFLCLKKPDGSNPFEIWKEEAEQKSEGWQTLAQFSPQYFLPLTPYLSKPDWLGEGIIVFPN